MQSKNISILTKNQKILLQKFSKSKLTKDFVFTGGTALAEYYISYRFSEDLDFFSENDIEVEPILTFLKSLKPILNYTNLNYTKSWNRNLFYLEFEDEILKTEFTYFPFLRNEKPKIINGIQIEPLKELAVNKVFTIFQNPRFRDFTDLYMISNELKLDIENMKKQARIKFEMNIDDLTLARNFEKALSLEDIPKFIGEFDMSKFEKWIEKSKDEILKKMFA